METVVTAVVVVVAFSGLGWCLYELRREDD